MLIKVWFLCPIFLFSCLGFPFPFSFAYCSTFLLSLFCLVPLFQVLLSKRASWLSSALQLGTSLVCVLLKMFVSVCECLTLISTIQCWELMKSVGAYYGQWSIVNTMHVTALGPWTWTQNMYMILSCSSNHFNLLFAFLLLLSLFFALRSEFSFTSGNTNVQPKLGGTKKQGNWWRQDNGDCKTKGCSSPA